MTGTENLMMAATLARGNTTINNAAREPEIRDLAELLNKMGARVRGAGTPTIHIEGVEALGGAEHTIIPDRIETGTFMTSAAITQGELEIKDCNPEHCNRIIAKLRDAGVEVEEINQSTLHVRGSGQGLRGSDVITEPYPAFPTDMQAQYMTLMTQFFLVTNFGSWVAMHANYPRSLAGLLQCYAAGVPFFWRTLASDLRASASLVLAGLVAEGETIIDRVYHIDRGYERIEMKLRAVGADIERLRESVTTPLS